MTAGPQSVERVDGVKKVTRKGVGLIAVTAVVIVTVMAAVFFGGRHSLYQPYRGEPVEITVESGASMATVAAELETRDLVPSAVILRLYTRVTGDAAAIQSGRYQIVPGMRPVDIIHDMVAGNVIDDSVRVTIPEGWQRELIAARLARAGIVDREGFLDAAFMRDAYRGIDPLLDELDDDITLEGFLFPETYRLFPDMSPETVVRRKLRTFARRLDEKTRTAIAQQELSLREIVTLASIVEAESPTEDMPKVAGVFSKRLDRGMRLESDATVNYVLGTRMLQPTFADIAVDDPYNTYRYAGLPPGPIGNPGMKAIRAAASPDDNPYLFFLNKPTGETVFARTFAEHLENKARYLD